MFSHCRNQALKCAKIEKQKKSKNKNKTPKNHQISPSAQERRRATAAFSAQAEQ